MELRPAHHQSPARRMTVVSGLVAALLAIGRPGLDWRWLVLAIVVMFVQPTPNFGDVRAHYGLSDDFFRLFLDPMQTYACTYFERDDMTLKDAQPATTDLALAELRPTAGMTLLDVGCGWAATMRPAVERSYTRRAPGNSR